MKSLPYRSTASGTVRRVLSGVVLCGLVAAAPVAGAQAVRGLVIGIDDYAHINPLSGAVNDARDIEQALTGIGVEDLTVLLDGDATRARIEDEWAGLLERSARGDTVVLTYSGHGWQEPERVPGTETDKKDEALLLGGFRKTGVGTRERIIDDELHRWFLDAGGKGLKVVFVADTCHSGTLTREIDPRPPARTSRYVPPADLPNDMLTLDLPAGAADTGAMGEGALAHVSFLAAEQEHKQVDEVEREGKMRGALSYEFARALRGEADGDEDGVLRRGELYDFVRRNVRGRAEELQTPNLEPIGREDEVVLRLSPEPAGAAGGGGEAPSLLRSRIEGATEQSGVAAAGAAVDATPGMRLTVLNAGAATVAAVRETLPGVRVVPHGAPTDLLWDARQREVVSPTDVVAHEVGLDALTGVVAKWEAVHALREISTRNGLLMELDPGYGRHRRGAQLTVRVAALPHPRLTVFSLSGSGKVHYLYPLPFDDPSELVAGRPFALPKFIVTPPYGADHVVAVSAGSALDGLNDALMGLDGRVAAGRAAALLAEAKAGADGWSSGVLGLYTAP